MQRIAVIGGGLSGLAAAYELEKNGVAEIEIFEKSTRLGGVIQTETIGDYRIELSADMFSIEPPAVIELVQELGKTEELIETRNIADRAFLGINQQIYPIPRGFSLMQPSRLYPLLRSQFLSWEAKARLFAEQFVPPKTTSDDESLSSFATRRFGTEVFEKLIQPLASGIYTADPEKLSMQATMQRFVDKVASHFSLIAAGQAQQTGDKQASGARYNLFRAPREGMGQLLDWLQSALTNTTCRLEREVSSVAMENGKWRLKVNGSSTSQPQSAVGNDRFDGVIFTVAPPRVSAMLRDTSIAKAELLHDDLRSIQGASSAITVLGFDESQIKKKFDGFGLIFPASENRDSIAISFLSNKFDHRAPDGKCLLRVFAGGALRPELVELPDEELTAKAIGEVDHWLGLDGSPEFARVCRWTDCMPQYHIGHVNRVKRIREQIAGIKGLELAGNGYEGVGIPACIASGRAAARQLLG